MSNPVNINNNNNNPHSNEMAIINAQIFEGDDYFEDFRNAGLQGEELRQEMQNALVAGGAGIAIPIIAVAAVEVGGAAAAAGVARAAPIINNGIMQAQMHLGLAAGAIGNAAIRAGFHAQQAVANAAQAAGQALQNAGQAVAAHPGVQAAQQALLNAGQVGHQMIQNAHNLYLGNPVLVNNIAQGALNAAQQGGLDGMVVEGVAGGLIGQGGPAGWVGMGLQLAGGIAGNPAAANAVNQGLNYAVNAVGQGVNYLLGSPANAAAYNPWQQQRNDHFRLMEDFRRSHDHIQQRLRDQSDAFSAEIRLRQLIDKARRWGISVSQSEISMLTMGARAGSDAWSTVHRLAQEATQALRLEGFENGKAEGIGGVGNHVGLIKGLSDKHTNLIEGEHLFYIPSQDGKPPFKNEELQQIIRELMVGIYAFDTMPCFSLHFNSAAHLYPVIYPVYQNTLVGEVMGLLDYYMKGFLNGGFFKKDFVLNWQATKSNDPAVLKANLIDLHQLCENELGEKYFSIQEYLFRFEQFDKSNQVAEVSPIFSDYSGFRSSFRIIAKQNSIRKSENLFCLDGGFDVLYSIEPDPSYQEELNKYQSLHGKYPPGYRRLVKSYEMMKKQIETMMPRLSCFRELFEQLKVINFFCYYLNTLKHAQKIPIVKCRETNASFGCPPLFPHLPIRRVAQSKIPINTKELFESVNQDQLKNYLKSPNGTLPPNNLVDAMLLRFRDQILRGINFPLSEDPQVLQQRRQWIISLLTFWVESSKNYFREVLADSGQLTQDLIEQEIANFERGRNDHWLQNEIFQDLISYELPYKEQNLCVQLYQELPEQEQNKCKRIVGGCGLDLSNITVTSDPLGNAILNASFDVLSSANPEEFKPVRLHNENNSSGFVFKLDCADFPGMSHQDYAWMQFLTEKEQPLGVMFNKWAPYASIYKDEGNLFEKQCSEDQTNLKSKDCHGISLVHHAALSASDRYLKFIHNKNVSLDVTDPFGLTPLHYAARKGAIDNMVFILAKMPGLLDKRAKNNATPLYLAAQNGHLDAVKLLLKYKANVNVQVLHGMTPLYCAIFHGHDDVVWELLNVPGIDVNLPLEDGSTPLHLAVEKGNEKVVRALLNKSADPTKVKIDGMTPWHCAAKSGSESMIKLLLSNPGVKNRLDMPLTSGQTALHLAATHHLPNIVDLILGAGADPTKCGWDGETPLLVAIRTGNALAAQCLIEQPLGKTTLDQRNIHGETPLKVALEGRLSGVVELLLHYLKPASSLELVCDLCRAHIDPHVIRSYSHSLPSNEKKEALAVCAQSGHNLMVSHLVLIDKVPDFGDRDHPGLYYYAAKYDHVNLIMKALNERDKNEKVQFLKGVDKQGKRVVEIAAEHGSLRALKRLLDAMVECDVSFVNERRGSHLLSVAIEAGELEASDAIIHQMGRDLNISLDSLGRSAPHLAAKNGDVEMLNLLKSRGFSFNKVDREGKTPFHYAIMYEWDDAIVYLIDEKRELTIPDDIRGALVQPEQMLLVASAQKLRKCPLRNLSRDDFLSNAKQHRNKTIVEDDKGRTLLFYLLQSRQIDEIRDLLQSGSDPNHMTDKRISPLFHAIEIQSSVKTIELLLEHGARINQTCGAEQQTSLHHAVVLGNSGIVHLLLSKGADVNKADLRGRTPLHLAAKSGNFGLVRKLCMAGASLHALDHDGLSAVHYAVRSDNPAIVEALKEWGLSINTPTKIRVRSLRKSVSSSKQSREGLAPLHLAAHKGKLVMLRTLLLRGCHLEATDQLSRGVLFYAALSGKMEVVTLFKGYRLMQDQRIQGIKGAILADSVEILEMFYGCELNKKAIPIDLDLINDGTTGLHFASINGSLNASRYFLRQGADPDKKDMDEDTPTSLAIKHKRHELARILVSKSKKFDVNDSTQNFLHLACEGNDIEMARFLIEQGVDVNHQDSHGLTALYYAVKNNRFGFAHLLLAFGASLNRAIIPLASERLRTLLNQYFIAKKEDENLLHLAVRCDDEQHLSLLLLKNSLMAKNGLGETPLHLAVARSKPAMVRMMVEYNRDAVNVRDNLDRTPLFLAASLGNSPEVIKMLLQANAYPDLDNKELETALFSISKRQYSAETFEMFQLIYQKLPKADLKQPSEMMLKAIMCHDLKLFYQCINHGHPVSNSHFSLLHIATNIGSIEIVHHLVHWFDVNINMRDIEGKTVVDIAVKSKQHQLARFFIQNGGAVERIEKIQIELLSQLEDDILQKLIAFDEGWKRKLVQFGKEHQIPREIFQHLIPSQQPQNNSLWTQRRFKWINGRVIEDVNQQTK